MNGHIIANDGTITFTHNSRAFTVSKSHPVYNKIVTALKGRKFNVAAKLTETRGIKNAMQKLSNKITIENGSVLFNGQSVGGVVVERILKFINEGLPYKPLVRFLENIQENPSARSVQELYMFLEHGNMPITEDGCFIGYKAITHDWKDKHSRTFDNSVGKTCEVPRNTVDDDFRNGCSRGLHIGSYKYANEFATGDDRIVLVKVNPADAVSVPEDCQFQKLRAWRYKVVAEVERESPPLEQETFGEIDSDDCQDCGQHLDGLDCLEDDDTCDECGGSGCYGGCDNI